MGKLMVVRGLVSSALDGCSFTARRGLIKGMRVRGGSAFLPGYIWPRWQETAETRFLASLELRGKVVYDIGALHGHLTMFFARQAKHVVAYEANPANVTRINENLRLNNINNVSVRSTAVGDRLGSLELTVDPRRPALATGDQTIARQLSKRRGSLQVSVVRLDDDILAERLPQPDLVKIDVEGMEVLALRGMERILRKIRPHLYIEIHGADVAQKVVNARGVIELLLAVGYEQILHIETGRTVGAAEAREAREGHLWAAMRTPEELARSGDVISRSA